MSGRFKWQVGLILGVLVLFFMIRWGLGGASPRHNPSQPPSGFSLKGEETLLPLPEPEELGRVLAPEGGKVQPAKTTASDEKKNEVPGWAAQDPAPFKLPPEEARRLKKEGAVTY
ncbi:MAG: hypothetical protein HYS41_02720 [Candidatus Omnitrophica bacterium]|nr:hypothetical protein [Candidatus Omnitrophota bacterium]